MNGSGRGRSRNERAPRVAILYHYMYPDDVVSAHHFDGLAQDLAESGWDVEALPCNRGRRDEAKKYARKEVYKGVRYRRIWRPRFPQESFLGRVANAACMLMAWACIALRSRAAKPDVVVVGTDPVFAAAVAIPIKLFAPGIKVAHWCFDLHPEAAVASGMLGWRSPLVRLTRWVMGLAYRRCDLIANLGTCMRERLREYEHNAIEIELTPWALTEPDRPVEVDRVIRRELFGDAQLGVLYSGNIGEAHRFEELLALARQLRDVPEIHFCFAVRGSRAEALQNAVTEEDRNISFAGFAPLDELEKRLGAADLHMACLQPEWVGISVPSKFFGSLAAGRPVVFSGSGRSAIADWISQFGVGWHLAGDTVEDVAAELGNLAGNWERIREVQAHCHNVYRSRFSRRKTTRQWNEALCDLIGIETSYRVES